MPRKVDQDIQTTHGTGEKHSRPQKCCPGFASFYYLEGGQGKKTEPFADAVIVSIKDPGHDKNGAQRKFP